MDIKDLGAWGISRVIYDIIENGLSYDEETGEVYFTSDDLEELQETLDNKLNGICGFVKLTEEKIESLKNRKKEIENNISYYEKRKERLLAFLKFFMEANEIEKKELSDYRLGTRKSSSVEIFDEDKVYEWLKNNPELEETCKTVKTEIKLNKNELKKALSDNNIEGCRIIENKNITIK